MKLQLHSVLNQKTYCVKANSTLSSLNFIIVNWPTTVGCNSSQYDLELMSDVGLHRLMTSVQEVVKNNYSD